MYESQNHWLLIRFLLESCTVSPVTSHVPFCWDRVTLRAQLQVSEHRALIIVTAKLLQMLSNVSAGHNCEGFAYATTEDTGLHLYCHPVAVSAFKTTANAGFSDSNTSLSCETHRPIGTQPSAARLLGGTPTHRTTAPVEMSCLPRNTHRPRCFQQLPSWLRRGWPRPLAAGARSTGTSWQSQQRACRLGPGSIAAPTFNRNSGHALAAAGIRSGVQSQQQRAHTRSSRWRRGAPLASSSSECRSSRLVRSSTSELIPPPADEGVRPRRVQHLF